MQSGGEHDPHNMGVFGAAGVAGKLVRGAAVVAEESAFANFHNAYPDPVALPDATPVFRYSSTPSGMGALEPGRPYNFWSVGTPNAAYADTHLTTATLGELRAAGVVRLDPGAPAGEAVAVYYPGTPPAAAPGVTMPTPIIGYDPRNGAPILAGQTPVGPWKDLSGNMHFSDE